jgi:Putative zinc-finger
VSESCASPLTWQRLVDYWAGDLDAAETDAVDEHLFACIACSTESARVARIVQAFRAALPAVISEEQMLGLRARGVVVEENHFVPGRRQEVCFEPDVDILIHHLGGLDLSIADRVDVVVRVESTGAVLFHDHFAPFDRDKGEVLVACQPHFAGMPSDIEFDVHAHAPSGVTSLSSFSIPHVFRGGHRAT